MNDLVEADESIKNSPSQGKCEGVDYISCFRTEAMSDVKCSKKTYVLGVFTQRKATSSFVIFVRLSVHQFACIKAAPSGQIYLKFGLGDYKNLLRKYRR